MNISGLELVEAGYNGLNRICQSEKGVVKVTTACLSEVPRSTDAMSEYPVLNATWKALLRPSRACH